jgi:hypothetical protein
MHGPLIVARPQMQNDERERAGDWREAGDRRDAGARSGETSDQRAGQKNYRKIEGTPNRSRRQDETADGGKHADDRGRDRIDRNVLVPGPGMRREGDKDRRERRGEKRLDQPRMEEIGGILVCEHDRPERPDAGGGAGEPEPAAQARQRVGGAGDDGEIKDDRPWIGVRSRHQQGRDARADEPEAGERWPVQDRGQDRRERDGPEGDEGHGRANETIEPVRGVDRAERGDRPRRRQYGGRLRQGAARLFAPAQELPGHREGNAEGEAERATRRRPEIALFDGIAHQQQAAQRQGDAADQDRSNAPQDFLPGRAPALQ